ncbi:MAG: VWA domain-containing protein [Herpetosiphonaceae bacterium]|nr:VWA domain-containing protein [Herpetosiphonaceae bacterium]
MSDVVQLSVTKARPELWVSTEPQVVYLHTIAQMTVTQRPQTPLNLCLALDRSSSMRGERLYQVKEAARQVVNQLGPRDAFALIAFNDRAEVIVPACTGADHTALHVAISSLEARGGTEMAQGLSLGLREIERPRLAGLNRLILLTDGRTYGDEQSCIELARHAQRRGIGLTAFGVGTEWNEDLLEMIAAGENSRTQYITSLDAIVPVFEAEIKRLRDTIARHVELLVTTHPTVQIASLYRVQPFIAPLVPHLVNTGCWRVPLGDWVVGSEQQCLIELILPTCSPGQQSIAKLELRYETMGAKPAQFATDVSVDALALEEPALAVEPDVRHVLERVTAYRLQAQAWEAVTKGRVAEATQTLQQAGMHLFNAGEIELAQTVHVEATRLLQNGSASTDGRKRIKYGTRGLIAGGKHADL